MGFATGWADQQHRTKADRTMEITGQPLQAASNPLTHLPIHPTKLSIPTQKKYGDALVVVIAI